MDIQGPNHAVGPPDVDIEVQSWAVGEQTMDFEDQNRQFKTQQISFEVPNLIFKDCFKNKLTFAHILPIFWNIPESLRPDFQSNL